MFVVVNVSVEEGLDCLVDDCDDSVLLKDVDESKELLFSGEVIAPSVDLLCDNDAVTLAEEY